MMQTYYTLVDLGEGSPVILGKKEMTERREKPAR